MNAPVFPKKYMHYCRSASLINIPHTTPNPFWSDQYFLKLSKDSSGKNYYLSLHRSHSISDGIPTKTRKSSQLSLPKHTSRQLGERGKAMNLIALSYVPH